jgi:hypothetical protein
MSFIAIGLCVVGVATVATVRPRIKKIMSQSMAPSLAGSYFAWLCVCAFSWPGLSPVVFPPLLLLLAKGSWGSSFMPFLSGPLKVAFSVLGVSALIVRVFVSVRQIGATATFVAALGLNALFLVVIVGLANEKAEQEISAAAAQLSPVCFQRSTFLTSLANLGNRFFSHSVVRVADGSQYYWSYSKQSFFKGNARLDPTFPCKAEP